VSLPPDGCSFAATNRWSDLRWEETPIVRVPIYKLDTFTERLFSGGPTAVCVLTEPLSDATMQDIAAENNLAETAFIFRSGAGWGIRWFTPLREVHLAGHPTLAAAWVVLNELEPRAEAVSFSSAMGGLRVERLGAMLRMDFPAIPARPASASPDVLSAVGGEPGEAFEIERIHGVEYRMLVYRSEDEIRRLRPDYGRLRDLEVNVLVTAPGEEVDFVSRMFCPALSDNEDPVTGSAHCTTAPFWARRLCRATLTARQLSPREPRLLCEVRAERVYLSGGCVPYLEGHIAI
jgi:PhzF family phenazine biosynthesis protein